MLTWTRTSRGLTAQNGEGLAILRRGYCPTYKGKLWSGQLWRVTQTRSGTLQEPGATFGRGDELTLLKRRAEAILLQTSSRWYRVKLGGYCFSADGTLYSCHWHQGSGRFHAGAGIESCPDDSFATLSEARAYCMKAIGGAA